MGIKFPITMKMLWIFKKIGRTQLIDSTRTEIVQLDEYEKFKDFGEYITIISAAQENTVSFSV